MADGTALSPDEQAALNAAMQGKPLPGAPAATAPPPGAPGAPAGALSPDEEQALTAAAKGAPPASAPVSPAAAPAVAPITLASSVQQAFNPANNPISAYLHPDPTQAAQDAAVWRQATNPDIAGPAIVHGVRTALNPLLEWGSNLGNRLAAYDPSLLGWLQTNRAANDAANQQAWNRQLQALTPAQQQAAQGVSALSGAVAPFAIGGAAEKGIQLGAAAAGAPDVGTFLTGGAGATTPGAAGYGIRATSRAAAGVTQGLATGGGPGAVIGGVFGPTVGAAAGNFVGTLSRRFGSGEAPAVQAIYQQMQRDGMTPQQLAASLSQLGPLGTVADVAEPNLSQLAEGIANSPGAGQGVAYRNLVSRNMGQTQRMVEATNAVTGGTATAGQTVQQLMRQRAGNAATAYGDAFANTAVTPADEAALNEFIGSPIGQRAFQTGMAEAQINDMIARSQGRMGAQNLAAYGVQQLPDGSFERIPGQPITLEGLNAIKKGYDRMVESYRDPTTMRINYSGNVENVPGMAGSVSVRTLDNLRNEFTSQLRQRFPLYANALDQWAGPSQAMDAISLGKRVLTNDDDVTAQNIANIAPGNRDMFATGVRDAITNRILSVQDRADAANRIFGNQLIRNKIAAGMGGVNSPEFQQFEQAMERERTFWNTSNQMRAGSPTARRIAGQAMAQQATGGPSWGAVAAPFGHLLAGNPLAAAAHVAQVTGPQIQAWLAQPSDRMSAALGNYLFTPAGGQNLINRLQLPVPPSALARMTGWQGQQALQALARGGGLYSPGGTQ